MTRGEKVDFEKTMQRVWKMEATELARLLVTVDMEASRALADLLLATRARGGRFFFAGVGTSAAAAKKAAHTFCCVEFQAAFLSPGDAVHGGMGVVAEKDVVFLISKGGGTAEMVHLLDGLRAKKAVMVTVTENAESPIARAADRLVVIRVGGEPDPFNMLATASTLAVIAFFDAMAIWLMEKSGFTREQFAVIHPSGAVGERLTGGKP